MSKPKHPYTIIQRRVDIVVKVPAWAAGEITVGDEVIRIDSETVMLLPGSRIYKLGESYTKFFDYTT